MKADIIHISGFDTYDTHDSGNYIVFNLFRELNYDSKMILALGKKKPDKDTFLIPTNKILESIDEAKIIILHDSLFSHEEIKKMHEKLGCQIIMITMTHFHLTTQDSAGCPSYPELNSETENVSNQILLNNKKEAITNLPITLVYGSTYTGKITEEFNMYEEKVLIPLPADVTYCKNSKEEVRKDLNLPTNKKYIFWGTTQPQTYRKGKSLFDKCLDYLWSDLSEDQRSQIIILSVGPCSSIFGSTSRFKTVYCGYQKTRKEMSARYRASDISVCTTIADAGPMMISESMCNETPVIAFDRSIACDLCINEETGYLIKELDLNSMAFSIKKILFEDDLISMSQKSRKRYLTFHDKHIIINKWDNLLKNLMEKE